MLVKYYAHPRDTAIQFFDEYKGKNHVYVIEGADDHPTSVTQLIHKYFEEFDEDAIIEKYYEKWQADDDHKYYGLSKDAIKDLWEKNRVEASQLGTKMHALIEAFFNNELKERPKSVEFDYFANFWADFIRVNPGYRPHRVEWRVYTDSKKVSGSIDFTMIGPNGEIIIIDWKRSKKISFKCDWGRVGKPPLKHLEDCNYVHYSLQLNTYKYILEKYYGKTVKGMYLVILHPDNANYMMIPVYTLDKEVEMIMKEYL